MLPQLLSRSDITSTYVAKRIVPSASPFIGCVAFSRMTHVSLMKGREVSQGFPFDESPPPRQATRRSWDFLHYYFKICFVIVTSLTLIPL